MSVSNKDRDSIKGNDNENGQVTEMRKIPLRTRYRITRTMRRMKASA